jgi:hypothetical protein
MQVLQSTQPAFRYHWKWGPEPSPYLAAARVVVLELSDHAFVERCRPLVRALSAPAKPGGVSMSEPGPRWMADTSALLRDAMLGAGIAPFEMMDDLDPALALLHDQVRYHHDMPLWASVFGAWMLEGPERVLRFPLMDIEVPFRPGTVVLFDPAQPHGLLRPGATEYETFEDASQHAISMVSFSSIKRGPLAELLGIQSYDVRHHADVRHTVDQYKVCDRTGAIAFR